LQFDVDGIGQHQSCIFVESPRPLERVKGTESLRWRFGLVSLYTATILRGSWFVPRTGGLVVSVWYVIGPRWFAVSNGICGALHKPYKTALQLPPFNHRRIVVLV